MEWEKDPKDVLHKMKNFLAFIILDFVLRPMIATFIIYRKDNAMLCLPSSVFMQDQLYQL